MRLRNRIWNFISLLGNIIGGIIGFPILLILFTSYIVMVCFVVWKLVSLL